MILGRFRLDGQVAVVTGAGRGIGRAIALALGEAGATVVCAARTTVEIERTAATIAASGGHGSIAPTDVTSPVARDALIAKTLAEHGGIDVLVNVAGGSPPRVALATDDAALEEAFRFNCGSAFALSRAAAPHMLARGRGSIVNISSAMSHVVDSGFVAYGAAKAALDHLTRLLGYEWAPKIRVNAIAVGAVETDALTPFLAMDGLRAAMEAKTPMARIGQPEDIAAMALFLASPAADWITGKVFEVDGGAPGSTWPLRIPGY